MIPFEQKKEKIILIFLKRLNTCQLNSLEINCTVERVDDVLIIYEVERGGRLAC